MIQLKLSIFAFPLIFALANASCYGHKTSSLKRIRASLQTNESNLLMIQVSKDGPSGRTKVSETPFGDTDALESILQTVSEDSNWRHIIVVWDRVNSPDARQALLHRCFPSIKERGTKLTVYTGSVQPFFRHWLSPLDQPEDSAATMLFANGRKIGTGTSGPNGALQLIEKERPTAVVLLGNIHSQLVANPAPPFDGLRQNVISRIEKSNGKVVELGYFSPSDM